MHIDRTWPKHRHPNTDTESTDDECTLGGYPTFSHGSVSLSHQHWVAQVISAGGFGVHCTQAAEAHHKQCMKLASQRVRHLNYSRTIASMLEYLKTNYLFDFMLADLPVPRARAKPAPRLGLGHIMSCDMGTNFARPAVQQTFLHREVRIARFEVLDLLCVRLGIPTTRESYVLLETMTFRFYQRLSRRDGKVYWATDTQYSHGSSRRRRDSLHVRGSETVRRRQPDGSLAEVQNALCCQAVCFLQVSNVGEFLVRGGSVPNGLREGDPDSLTFVLGRWFEPHPNAHERDSTCRPVCPGELHINHCLWRFAVTPGHRRALFRRDGSTTPAVIRQRATFGRTVAEQQRCLQEEKRAYYSLFTPTSIIGIPFMCPLFLPGTATPDPNTWLQTVTVV